MSRSSTSSLYLYSDLWQVGEKDTCIVVHVYYLDSAHGQVKDQDMPNKHHVFFLLLVVATEHKRLWLLGA